MCKTDVKSRRTLILLALLVGLFWATQAGAQTTEPVSTGTAVTDPVPAAIEEVEDPDPEEPVAETVDVTNPPPFILALLEATAVKQDQVDQMRADGAGWGSIGISVLLADQIAVDSEGTVTFDDALASVLAARAEGMGYGQIAGENGLQIGELVRRRSRVRERTFQNGSGEQGEASGVQVRRNARVREKRQNALGRLVRFLGLGKPERPDRPSRPERVERPARAEKVERPERPERPERLERPERPEKPEKPERGPKR